MTIAQAIAALHAAGLTDAHFRHGSLNFTIKGKLCGIRTDFRAQVNPEDIAFWVRRAA